MIPVPPASPLDAGSEPPDSPSSQFDSFTISPPSIISFPPFSTPIASQFISPPSAKPNSSKIGTNRKKKNWRDYCNSCTKRMNAIDRRRGCVRCSNCRTKPPIVTSTPPSTLPSVLGSLINLPFSFPSLDFSPSSSSPPLTPTSVSPDHNLGIKIGCDIRNQHTRLSLSPTSCLYLSSTPPPSPLKRSSRTKKDYSKLGEVEQRKRRKAMQEGVRELELEVGCPLSAITPTPATPTISLLHLSTSDRHRIRTIEEISIPCERTIIKTKLELATTVGTATASFTNGAYLTDPLTFIASITSSSPFICVGGDKGGEETKIGITYEKANGVQAFVCLLVYEGKDDWTSLNRLKTPNLTPFSGSSQSHPHIFSILQHLINSRNSYLNGDWCFINAIVGLKSPSCHNPCPICPVDKKKLLLYPRYRQINSTKSKENTPLLLINPNRIVPLPLHVLLGLSNRIINKRLIPLFTKEKVELALKPVKTIHTAGRGGRGDLFDLNGPEIGKWIRYGCVDKLKRGEGVSEEDKGTATLLNGWIENMHQYLLRKEWSANDMNDWCCMVTSIQTNWVRETNDHPFPKLHMLKHSVEFVQRHNRLGSLSESQIESYHASFNQLLNHNHSNLIHNPPERLRRCLADTSLRAAQSSSTP